MKATQAAISGPGLALARRSASTSSSQARGWEYWAGRPGPGLLSALVRHRHGRRCRCCSSSRAAGDAADGRSAVDWRGAGRALTALGWRSPRASRLLKLAGLPDRLRAAHVLHGRGDVPPAGLHVARGRRGRRSRWLLSAVPARARRRCRRNAVLAWTCSRGLLQGFAVALHADEPAVVLRRRVSRHGGRHPARARAGGDHRDAAAAHLPDGSDQRASSCWPASTTAPSTAARPPRSCSTCRASRPRWSPASTATRWRARGAPARRSASPRSPRSSPAPSAWSG